MDYTQEDLVMVRRHIARYKNEVTLLEQRIKNLEFLQETIIEDLRRRGEYMPKGTGGS